MAKDTRSTIEQLEDVLLRVGPVLGGVPGMFIGAALLKDIAPRLVGFIIGGTMGAALAAAALYGLFMLINPKRDRRRVK